MKKLLVFIFISLVSYEASAGGLYVGKFKPYFWSGSLYIKPIGGTATGKPNCATRSLLRLQESDPNNPIFKYKFTMLYTAWVSQKEMELRGTGDCSVEGDEIIFAVIPQ